MIYIDRDRRDENGTQIRPNNTWFDRATEARELALEEMGEHEADGEIYAADSVRSALEELFIDKCAYCESDISATTDWEVDHFRPKGRVAERDEHPGYYWLTYEWDNLYPSCTHCNQRRRDRPRWGDVRFGLTGGKADQFPLENEETRCMDPTACHRDESTLLIDPCWDTPSWYLGFDPRGGIFALRQGGVANPYGETTISVFNLRRRRLRKAREKTLAILTECIRLARSFQAAGRNEDASKMFQLIERTCLDDKCTYAGAARFVYKLP